MRNNPWVNTVFLWFALCFLPTPANAVLLDRVVASVNYDVITLSELNQAVSFNTALGAADGETMRAQTLEGLVNRRLLLQEAHRLRFVEISDQDITAEADKLRQRLGSGKAFEEFLARTDITTEQLRRMLAERLLVERFIERKIGLFIRVNRDEAEDFYKRSPDLFRGKRFSEVQKAITAHLQEQKIGQQISQYLAELKGRADIREQL